VCGYSVRLADTSILRRIVPDADDAIRREVAVYTLYHYIMYNSHYIIILCITHIVFDAIRRGPPSSRSLRQATMPGARRAACGVVCIMLYITHWHIIYDDARRALRGVRRCIHYVMYNSLAHYMRRCQARAARRAALYTLYYV
jgi:hypothetical protein